MADRIEIDLQRRSSAAAYDSQALQGRRHACLECVQMFMLEYMVQQEEMLRQEQILQQEGQHRQDGLS
jgi:hypothetical protein